ncbi:MAG: fatty acid desaturase [Alphaproteobacteria bacterium]|nr:fatty acid desaturase [Alphaproteobacteria bacterium]
MPRWANGNSVNVVLLGGVAFVAALQLHLLPLSGQMPAMTIVLLAALTAPLHYGLMHETMHGHLFGHEPTDRAIGRALGIVLGLPWETMRFGHLAHHSMNRHTFDRPEVLEPDRARLPATGVYYFKLIVGHAVSYALMPLPALFPVSTTGRVLGLMGSGPGVDQLRNRALVTFTNPKRRNAIRFDIAAIFALFGFAFWAWGASWPVFAGCVVARWSVLSLLDNAPHYGMPLESGLDARNTSLPAVARLLVMNGNYHGTHHRNPQLRWHELPRAFEHSGALPEGNWLAAVARQFRGLVILESP